MPASPEGIPAVYEVNGREDVAISARPNPDRIRLLGDEVAQDSSAGGPMQNPAVEDSTEGYYVYALPEAATRRK